MAVHSQLISCSASEVHAMVEGAMRHGTSMEVEQNFVDSHGASFVGFGITRLLDFDLIARFKQINTMKLYVPGSGGQNAYPALAPALTRPVRWEIIENNYDLMLKYATAIRLRTASTEALLRRFTSETTHPAYAAMLKTGRAQPSTLLARWPRDRGGVALQGGASPWGGTGLSCLHVGGNGPLSRTWTVRRPCRSAMDQPGGRGGASGFGSSRSVISAAGPCRYQVRVRRLRTDK